MEDAWRKAKRALGLRLCVQVPVETSDGGGSERRRPVVSAGCRSDAAVTVGPESVPPPAVRRSKSGSSRSFSKVIPSLISMAVSEFRF
ncbi:hypothetical protein GUJ93_ZPchr0004g38752 [Zizania palustris]|uniref:Uncharacterized protein n=1 Tax=Zizania palustris TaxID=103762 RepID=A0A8J5SJL5_ZIZPA|nr:hypothetical protein GUJ93_ZPchr0004g38752 [Zizania palustris]